jgi:hypothetical protein
MARFARIVVRDYPHHVRPIARRAPGPESKPREHPSLFDPRALRILSPNHHKSGHGPLRPHCRARLPASFAIWNAGSAGRSRAARPDQSQNRASTLRFFDPRALRILSPNPTRGRWAHCCLVQPLC